MSKEIRRAFYNAGRAINNFFFWVPKATKHFFEETPSSLAHFKSWLLSFRGGLTVVSLIVLMLIPAFIQLDYYMSILIDALIFAILAASWDFLAGVAGQVSFGHAGFFGLGGYLTAIYFKYSGYPWPLALLVGAIIALLFGLLIGVLCLRLKGPYFALGTLAFALILNLLFTMDDFPYGGTDGISWTTSIAPNKVIIFFIMLGFMLLTFVFLHAVVSSRTGTILKSIRDDETCAGASGINTTKYKLLAIAISAFFAGLAGAIYVLFYKGVNPAVYGANWSFYAIIMAALGGISTISGAIIGAFFFVILRLILTDYLNILLPFINENWALAIFSLILVGVILAAKQGIMNPIIDNLKKLYDLTRRR